MAWGLVSCQVLVSFSICHCPNWNVSFGRCTNSATQVCTASLCHALFPPLPTTLCEYDQSLIQGLSQSKVKLWVLILLILVSPFKKVGQCFFYCNPLMDNTVSNCNQLNRIGKVLSMHTTSHICYCICHLWCNDTLF